MTFSPHLFAFLIALAIFQTASIAPAQGQSRSGQNRSGKKLTRAQKQELIRKSRPRVFRSAAGTTRSQRKAMKGPKWSYPKVKKATKRKRKVVSRSLTIMQQYAALAETMTTAFGRGIVKKNVFGSVGNGNLANSSLFVPHVTHPELSQIASKFRAVRSAERLARRILNGGGFGAHEIAKLGPEMKTAFEAGLFNDANKKAATYTSILRRLADIKTREAVAQTILRRQSQVRQSLWEKLIPVAKKGAGKQAMAPMIAIEFEPGQQAYLRFKNTSGRTLHNVTIATTTHFSNRMNSPQRRDFCFTHAWKPGHDIVLVLNSTRYAEFLLALRTKRAMTVSIYCDESSQEDMGFGLGRRGRNRRYFPSRKLKLARVLSK